MRPLDRPRACALLMILFTLTASACGANASRPSSDPRVTDAPRNELAGDFSADDTTVGSCAANDSADDPGERAHCRAQALGNIAATRGAATAFRQLRALGERDPTWTIDAHVVAHLIGSANLERRGDNVALAFADGEETGAGGYYHGVLLAAVDEVPLDELPDRAGTICDDPSVRSQPWLAGKCVHAIGHALMIASGYELPESLEACDQLSRPEDRVACHTGVFMENYSRFLISTGTNTKWLRDDDLLFPCNAVEEQYQSPCYVQVVTRIGSEVGWRFDEIAGWCRKVPPRHRGACMESYGGWAWSLPGAPTPEEVAARCRLAGSDLIDGCIGGVARYMANVLGESAKLDAFCAEWRGSQRAMCSNSGAAVVRARNQGVARDATDQLPQAAEAGITTS